MLAALPQHIAQVGGVALGACFVLFGIVVLVKGPPPELLGEISPRLVQVFPPVAIILGIGVGVLFFFVDAGGPNSERDHWGGAWEISMLVLWLAVLFGIAIHNLRKYRNVN